MAAPKPSVGSVVHFQYEAEGLQPYAAIITGLREGGHVDLTVFPPPGSGRSPAEKWCNIPFAPEPSRLCWSWPPRVDG